MEAPLLDLRFKSRSSGAEFSLGKYSDRITKFKINFELGVNLRRHFSRKLLHRIVRPIIGAAHPGNKKHQWE